MSNAPTLHAIDWIIIASYVLGTIAVGLYFTRRGSKSLESFFVTGRSLPWYVAGISMVATSFASDTPLWVSSLVRRHGVYYVWQYWVPIFGTTLAVVLFARLWRRTGVLTDVEFIELRYSGRAAAGLRFFSGFTQAAFYCPLAIGWVVKAMETITRETTGLPSEYRAWTTVAVIAAALLSCTFSGLWGVVYTDLIQFTLGFICSIILAVFAVNAVGGLDAMVTQLGEAAHCNGNVLNIAPQIGPGADQMSIWNAIGYFGILWIAIAKSGGYIGQRILACKDSRQATFAMMLNTSVYHAIIAWPWIIVALCSLILIPDLGQGVSHDAAFPRMIVLLLPMGLRGLLVTAMVAAFMSTINTFLNWGSSYLVNDIYKRFVVRHASVRHYVNIGRAATLFMAAFGGIISFLAYDIQHLLTIAYVLGAGLAVVGHLRWFWWRFNATGELVATIVSWMLAPLLLFPCGFGEPIFDAPMRFLFGVKGNFSNDPNLLGARMLFMLVSVTATAIVTTLLTPPTDDEHLRRFLLRVRPFRLLWRPVIKRLEIDYPASEGLGRTLVSWLLAIICLCCLLLGLGKLFLGEPLLGVSCLAIFAVTLRITLRRIKEDLSETMETSASVSPCDELCP